ncbi:MAG: hypothetical protein LBI36_03895 [Oscillospiraceae bacterium]|jgi:hypothetical protein|nr:hypothetical protein [Oscillospiraceae bacterium]
MKKPIIITLAAAIIFAGCNKADDNAPEESETVTAGETTAASLAATAAKPKSTTMAAAGTTLPTVEEPTREEKMSRQIAEYEFLPVSELFDENRLINDKGIEQIRIIGLMRFSAFLNIGLYDFDGDNIPEVFNLIHDGGQALKPCYLYSLDGKYIGEFRGYCRDGETFFIRDENGVYVHNYYEHSNWKRVELIDNITITDAGLELKTIFGIIGETDGGTGSFNLNYFVNGERVDKIVYENAYGKHIYEGGFQTREANEYSVCSYNERKYIQDHVLEAVRLYNRYVAVRNSVISEFGVEPQVFAYRNYDGSGNYGAFVQLPPGYDDNIYYADGKNITLVAKNRRGAVVKEVYGLCVFQSENSSAYIFGVEDGVPYESILSGKGADLAHSPYHNDELLLTDFQTSVPYFFDYPYHVNYFGKEPPQLKELGGVKTERGDLESTNGFDNIFEHIESQGGEITEIFIRGDYKPHVNINFRVLKDGVYYEWYLTAVYMWRSSMEAVIIDEGAGRYRAALIPEIAVYPDIAELLRG